MNPDTPLVPPPTDEQAGSAYPIAALMFEGPQAAIANLRAFAQSRGIKLSDPELSTGDHQRVRFLSNDFGPALKVLFDEARGGRLGDLKFSIMSGAAPVAPHDQH